MGAVIDEQNIIYILQKMEEFEAKDERIERELREEEKETGKRGYNSDHAYGRILTIRDMRSLFLSVLPIEEQRRLLSLVREPKS